MLGFCVLILTVCRHAVSMNKCVQFMELRSEILWISTDILNLHVLCKVESCVTSGYELMGCSYCCWVLGCYQTTQWKWNVAVCSWQNLKDWEQKCKDMVKVKDEFSWKSLGAKSDGCLKYTVSREKWVLQKMRLGILKMYYTSISNFFLALELKKKILSHQGEQDQYWYHSQTKITGTKPTIIWMLSISSSGERD